VSNQAAAGAKLAGIKPHEMDEEGREVVSAEEMQEKLWKRIYAAKKECGRLNDTAIQKQSEAGGLLRTTLLLFSSHKSRIKDTEPLRKCMSPHPTPACRVRGS